MLCQVVIGPQSHNFTLKCCFLTWRRALENVDCYLKMSKHNFFLERYWRLQQGGMSSLIFWKLKLFWNWTDKNNVSIFENSKSGQSLHPSVYEGSPPPPPHWASWTAPLVGLWGIHLIDRLTLGPAFQPARNRQLAHPAFKSPDISPSALPPTCRKRGISPYCIGDHGLKKSS